MSGQDIVTRERLRRAEKALTDELPATNPLWKPWAMDLADDVNALVAERGAALRSREEMAVSMDATEASLREARRSRDSSREWAEAAEDAQSAWEGRALAAEAALSRYRDENLELENRLGESNVAWAFKRWDSISDGDAGLVEALAGDVLRIANRTPGYNHEVLFETICTRVSYWLRGQATAQARAEAVEAERDEWKREAELSKWPKEAAQEYHQMKVDLPAAEARVTELEAVVERRNAEVETWMRQYRDEEAEVARLREALHDVDTETRPGDTERRREKK